MNRARHRLLVPGGSCWLPLLAVGADNPRLAAHALEVGPAVLCPGCGGDWCAACNYTGMALPVDKRPGGGGLGKSPRRWGHNSPVGGAS